MTRGRRGNQTYTGFNGASDEQLRNLRLSNRGEANRQNRKLPPSPEAMRRAIEAGMCPYCGDQFKNIGAHTSRTHGIPTPELKEYLGIPKTHPICSPELSEKLSLEGKRRMDKAHMERMRSSRKGGKRELSPAGAKAQGDKFAKWRAEVGEEAAASQRAEALRRSKEKARNPERDAEIVRRVQDGEYQKEVARSLGVSLPTVKRALVRAGITHDRRADVARRRYEELPQILAHNKENER